ncbi:MAG TPA: potassium-transporting ATPase subunit KdpA [Pirellulales bacterium]|jgi:K+-transporting ATPase ATPase A chain|nr:potassium-transporting ATPase subunit KdpA [Pirellulales bacterium]
MTVIGCSQILLFSLAVLALTKPMGIYMYRVFEGNEQPWPRVFGGCERLFYRLCGVRPDREQTWLEYCYALLAFSALTMAGTYAIERLQHVAPLNPQSLPAVPAELAFNTAASFTTNTNWQAYSGEAVMSYFTQMAGLAWHNFISAAAGIAVALVICRGLTRRSGSVKLTTVGNFWVDMVRSLVYLLLPISAIFALVLAAQGVIANLQPYLAITTVEGATQTLAMGPVASQEAIKELGTNGGGFFNANSAHPFENPTPLTNFLELVSIFAIPAGLTYTLGRMAGNQKQGWALFGTMAILFGLGVGVAYWSECQPNPALANLPIDQTVGNLEGKEVRFGLSASALFATVTTDASCGAVNSMHDSFNPIGGLVPLVNIQLGEIIFGGVGAGMYGMLVFVVLTVFIAGLMVGRTPEYLGKKIEVHEMKLVMLYVLIFPLIILTQSAWSAIYEKQASEFAAALPPADATAAADTPPPVPDNWYGGSSLNNSGPHGLSEMLYAFTSGTGNNGSAFAGLNANTPWWNLALGVTMLAGRFLMIVPVLALAGSLVGKKTVPAGLGTFPTDSLLFVGLLTSVILIVGALTFFPALSLGPIVEAFAAHAHKLF